MVETMEACQRLGFFPSTVAQHERKHDGHRLVTTDSDPNNDFRIYDDGRAPARISELKE